MLEVTTKKQILEQNMLVTLYQLGNYKGFGTLCQELRARTNIYFVYLTIPCYHFSGVPENTDKQVWSSFCVYLIVVLHKDIDNRDFWFCFLGAKKEEAIIDL